MVYQESAVTSAGYDSTSLLHARFTYLFLASLLPPPRFSGKWFSFYGSLGASIRSRFGFSTSGSLTWARVFPEGHGVQDPRYAGSTKMNQSPPAGGKLVRLPFLCIASWSGNRKRGETSKAAGGVQADWFTGDPVSGQPEHLIDSSRCPREDVLEARATEAAVMVVDDYRLIA